MSVNALVLGLPTLEQVCWVGLTAVRGTKGEEKGERS